MPSIGPVIPDYAGPNVRNLVPGILGPRAARPPWFPEALRLADQVVLLVVDGMGWHQLQPRLGALPVLAGLDGQAILTVAPSTTATVLTSITTGLTPAEHGILGYRMALRGDVVNMLRWHGAHGDVRRAHPPRDVQPFPPFLGSSPPVVGKVDLQGTAFSEAHLRGARHAGWRVISSLAVEVGAALGRDEPFVYAYYDGVDKVAHEHGFGPYYDAELRAVDRLVGDLLEVLPAGAALAVTADHGQVHVGTNMMSPAPEVARLVATQSGEGRFRWLHAHPGAAIELLRMATERHSDVAWVVSREQVLEEWWFGKGMSTELAARLGDVALVTYADTSFHDPADSGPFPLVCRHGSLTPAEMEVPLLVGSSAVPTGPIQETP